VKREELFIVSKLWNTFHDAERVEPIVKKQLADWGIEYFDLYLIHFPVALEWVDPAVRYPPGWHYDGKDEIRPSKATIQETWTAMESLVAKGLSKSIGISNFQAQLIYDLLRHAKIRPATLQIEHHPYLVQQELLNLAKHEGIAVTAYSSFGPASFLEFNMGHAVKLTPLIEDETIKKIAAKYNRDPSQVLLRWATQRGLAIIPKSTRPNIMASNFDSINFDLSEEDIATISGFNRGIRFNQPSNVSHPDDAETCDPYTNTRDHSTSPPSSSGSLAKCFSKQKARGAGALPPWPDRPDSRQAGPIITGLLSTDTHHKRRLAGGGMSPLLPAGLVTTGMRIMSALPLA
jgi:D-xylose reductase